MLKNFFALIVLISTLIVAGCVDDGGVDGAIVYGKVHIVTTVFPLYEFVREVGGDFVDVKMLLTPGVEPHAYEPKPSDIVAVSEADMFLMIGSSMEPWAEDLLSGVSNSEVKIFMASDYVDLLGNDPHIWLDFSNDMKIVEGLRDALIDLDEENAGSYKSNAEKYLAELQGLDIAYMDGLANCKKDTFITGGHNAYGYLANRYGVKFESAHGLAPDSEPTPLQLKSLVDVSRLNDLGYILFEEMTSPRLAEAIAAETSAQVVVVNPAANLSKEEFVKGVTFVDLMRENLDTFKLILECQN